MAATVSRSSGSFCDRDGVCTVSTCGSTGGMLLEFQSATDDRSAPAELGYRLRLLEGFVPPALEAPLAGIELGGEEVRFELPFDAVSELDATFELIAVDRAVAEDPALAERLDMHRRLRSRLSHHYGPIEAEPVPAAMLTLLEESAKVVPLARPAPELIAEKRDAQRGEHTRTDHVAAVEITRERPRACHGASDFLRRMRKGACT